MAQWCHLPKWWLIKGFFFCIFLPKWTIVNVLQHSMSLKHFLAVEREQKKASGSSSELVITTAFGWKTTYVGSSDNMLVWMSHHRYNNVHTHSKHQAFQCIQNPILPPPQCLHSVPTLLGFVFPHLVEGVVGSWSTGSLICPLDFIQSGVG